MHRPDSVAAGLKYRRFRRASVPPASQLMRLPAIAYFAIGGFAMFFGLFFVTFLRDVPELLYLCGPVTFIPGTIAIVLGVMQWRPGQGGIEFATWAKSQRRIKMDVMGQRIGKKRLEKGEV